VTIRDGIHCNASGEFLSTAKSAMESHYHWQGSHVLFGTIDKKASLIAIMKQRMTAVTFWQSISVLCGGWQWKHQHNQEDQGKGRQETDKLCL
jgi:hypothetical protein